MVPFDVWVEIAQHVPPNPFTYIRLSQTSRETFLAFTRDELWRRITPSKYQKQPGLYAQFLERLKAMTADEQSQMINLWARKCRILAENHKLRVRYYLRDLAALYSHNGDMILAMCMIDGSTLEFVPNWHYDFQIVQNTLESYGYALCFVDEALRDDYDLVMRAVENTSVALCHASPRLRNDPEIVRCAVKAHGFSFCYASDELRRDRAFCLDILRQTGRALEFVHLNADRKLVLAAVRNYGPAIQYAAPHLRADKEIVLRAVRNHGTVLALVAPCMRDDIDVVLTAVRSEPWALEHASPRLRNTYSLVVEAVGRKGWCLKYASPELRGNPSVALLAVHTFPGALKYASTELRDDFSIVCTVISSNPSVIGAASTRIQVIVYAFFSLLAYFLIPAAALIKDLYAKQCLVGQ